MESLLNILVMIEMSAAVVVFVLLFFISAPYGRHVRKGWGPSISSRNAWMTMEFPAFFVIAVLVITHLSKTGWYGVLFLSLWEIHYLYRVFVYPFLLTRPGKPFPAVLVLFALLFNILNGSVNGASLVDKGEYYLKHGWVSDTRLWMGVVLFLCGFLLHVRSDAILRDLRKKGRGEYQVPDSGLFRMVTSPNYLGEILEWTGWAIATWSTAGLAFALFTIANLLPRAYGNHLWYRETFPEYPRQRRILVPFIW
jgi:3-oxo-5-alpha-steroid 4-dehydrogenase 1